MVKHIKHFKYWRRLALCCFWLVALFAFTWQAQAGDKNINIKLAQYSELIEFNCPAGAAFELGNTPGTINPGALGKITGRLISKAQKRFHVMVVAVALDEERALEPLMVEWRQLGYQPETMIIGSPVYNNDGSLLVDNRQKAATVGVFVTKAEAQALVDKLAAQGKSSWIHTEIVALAKGELSLYVNGVFKATGADLLIVPNTTIELKKVEYAAGYPWHGFADRDYEGRIACRYGAWDAIDVLVNTSLENVLAGVVPSEISANAEIGALQAQAVAARGEILSKLGVRHKGEGFDTCSEQHCQVYGGITVYSKKVAPKIAPTSGYVLCEANGRILDAVYAANCGGHTEANHYVWSGNPNPILGGVWDHPNPPALDLSEEEQVAHFIKNPPQCYCNNPTVEGGNRFRWQKTLDRNAWQEVEARLGVGRIKQIKDIARGLSGRIYRMSFVGRAGEKTIMKELNIRRTFGSLMSACFTADYQFDSQGYIVGAKIEGAGFGHGVGMCQTGAQSLAQKGWSFQNILAHYFPGSLLKKWY